MATTQEILDAARKLGQLIQTHPSAGKLDQVMHKLQNDRDAQRALADYNRQLSQLSEKEASGRGIDMEDKRKLDAAQKALGMNLLLREFQMAQIDFLELMRQVDDLIDARGEAPAGAGAAPAPAPAAKSPIIMG